KSLGSKHVISVLVALTRRRSGPYSTKRYRIQAVTEPGSPLLRIKVPHDIDNRSIYVGTDRHRGVTVSKRSCPTDDHLCCSRSIYQDSSDPDRTSRVHRVLATGEGALSWRRALPRMVGPQFPD